MLTAIPLSADRSTRIGRMREISYNIAERLSPNSPGRRPLPSRARSFASTAARSPTRQPPQSLPPVARKDPLSARSPQDPRPKRGSTVLRFPKTRPKHRTRPLWASAMRFPMRTPPAAAKRTTSTTAPFPPATSAPCSSLPGRRRPEVSFRPSTTSAPPRAPCHPAGRSASGGAAQRPYTVTVAFPATASPTNIAILGYGRMTPRWRSENSRQASRQVSRFVKGDRLGCCGHSTSFIWSPCDPVQSHSWNT